MAGLQSTRSIWSQGAVCRQCLRARLGAGVAVQRRGIRGKYGPKYTAKLDAAAEDWQKHATEIENGTQRNLFDILEERGFIKDTAGRPEFIRELMRTKRIGAYVGIDPTASSLHVGHLLPLMPLFWMYYHGYRAVSLVGGATAKVGDPSGRLKSREKMARFEQTANMAKLHYQLKKIWTNVESRAQRFGYEKTWAWRRALLNNNTWWNKLPMLEVLRIIGAGMRVGPMLSRDTVKTKMEKGDGLSFAEFSYPLMQGWDWWHMFKAIGVQMQIGGSDQFGNIVTGIETIKLARENDDSTEDHKRKSEFDDPVGFTVPLLTDSSGAKFGKSAGNAVWLDPFQTSSADLYGYFVRRPDADVENLLKLFTFLPLEDIQKTMEEHNVDPSKRVAQHLLAYEVVDLVHGTQVANEAQNWHRSMFGQAQVPQPSSAENADPSQYQAAEGQQVVLNSAPRIDMKLPESLVMGKSIARILFAAGLASSTSEANRLVSQQAAYIGGAPGQASAVNKGMLGGLLQFTPVKMWVPADTKNFLIDGKLLILRRGKHNVRIVEMVSDEEWKDSGMTYPGEPYTGKVRKLREVLGDERLKKGDVDLRDWMDQDLKKEEAALAGDLEKKAKPSTGDPFEDAFGGIQEKDDEPTIIFPKRRRPVKLAQRGAGLARKRRQSLRGPNEW